MGKQKAGFLTPKAIANRIKSKGLQKLRWYCQMCQKQCRDENGFKCHCTSESHQRQLLLFAENPDKYLDSFSQEFFDDFMYLLKRRFGTRRVHGNIVYQEFVSDREHTHMNATKWETLTDFVKWLGRDGHCVVDETPKGWFITYIDKDPEVIARQKSASSKEKQELDDNERVAKYIEKQIERAKESHGETSNTIYTELKREDAEEKIQFDFGGAGPSKVDSMKRVQTDHPKKLESLIKKSDATKVFHKDKTKKRKSALDEILEEEKEKRKKVEAVRKENWLTKDIVVKIVTKKLGEKYYKKKAVVKDIKNLFIGVVEVLGTEDILKLDQSHLETVLPAVGKEIKIVNGQYHGHIAVMMGIDEKKFKANVKLKAASKGGGGEMISLPYEDVSKLA